MPLIAVHTSPELHLPQMVRPLTMPVLWEPAPLSEVNEEICQICPVNKRSPRTGTDRSRSTHSNPRLNKMTQFPLQHHNRQEEAHSCPLHSKGSNNTSTHHPHQVDTCIHHHHHQCSTYHRIIRSSYSRILILLLHYSRWPSSINSTLRPVKRALNNITSSMSFTSTVSCIPIYDGKDKDACTKWLQRCKEASFHTRYSFRSALLQRSSRDVANIIRSLDEDLLHDRLIEEIMCAFLGICVGLNLGCTSAVCVVTLLEPHSPDLVPTGHYAYCKGEAT